MATTKTATKTKAINKGGRPHGKKDTLPRIRSKEGNIRKTLKSLQGMEELAIENIKSSLEKDDIDREVVATSKWLLTTLVSMSRAAIAEDSLNFETQVFKTEQMNKEKGDNIIKFSSKLVKYEEDEEEDE